MNTSMANSHTISSPVIIAIVMVLVWLVLINPAPDFMVRRPGILFQDATHRDGKVYSRLAFICASTSESLYRTTDLAAKT